MTIYPRTPALIAAGALTLGALAYMSQAEPSSTSTSSPAEAGDAAPPEGVKTELATFASGCFWCTEAVFQELAGVYKVTSGYSGGEAADADYKVVSTGRTDHAEAVQVEYDPKQVDYATLLEVFWKTHDPTTPNRQGADVGPQYRSAVFYHNGQQKQLAEEYQSKLDKSGVYDAPIVTEITRFDSFYPAEDYHQDFLNLNPEHPYCRAVVGPKVEKFRKVFGDKLKNAPKKNGEKNAKMTDDASAKFEIDQAELKQRLTPLQFQVTQHAGTERPFNNEFWNNKESGEYHCIVCGDVLFTSDNKYDSGCGWPSFTKPEEAGAVTEHNDSSHGMVRTEVRCKTCGAHLGHVFNDGPATAGGLRYCINSASLDFDAEEPADAGKDQ